jgi:ribonucleotide reductase alpha subunit
MKYGLRNSLDIALMPSASTSTIAMNTETVEAPMTNIFERRLMNGNYPVLNQYMELDLREIGAWNDRTIQLIDADTGSISKLTKFIKEHPQWYPNFQHTNNESWQRLEYLQTKYKTMWELSTKTFISLAAERGIHIDQSASSNNYMKHPTYKKLRAAHVTSIKKRVKTIEYYLRQEPARPNSKITVDPRILSFVEKIEIEIAAAAAALAKAKDAKKKKTTNKSRDKSKDKGKVVIKQPVPTHLVTEPIIQSNTITSEEEISVSELTFEASTKGKPVGSRFVCSDGSCCE